MRVKAIAEFGTDLSKKTLGTFHVSGTWYQLIIGDIYTVYGIIMRNGIVHYLAFNFSHEFPYPFPAELYQIVDNRIPKEWYFNFFGYDTEDEFNAFWGYKELVLNHQHYFDLMDREHEALKIFYARQKEIDEFHNQLGGKSD